jgi:putative ABC transport system permease protein
VAAGAPQPAPHRDRFLSALLFNVQATDPFTYLVVVVFLAAVAQAASFIPAYRATTIDPVNTLREE